MQKRLLYTLCVFLILPAFNNTHAQDIRGVAVTGKSSVKNSKPISKQVSHEVNAKNGSFIRVVSAAGKLNIKSWNQSKVKVTVDIEYDSSLQSRSDEEWFESLGISVKPFSDRVDIITRKGINAGFYSVYGKPKADIISSRAVPSQSNLFGTAQKATTVYGLTSGARAKYNSFITDKTTIKSMTIQLPAGCKLDVDNEYGDVIIGMDLDEAKLEISNGTLDAGNIKDLTLIGKYCNANLGDIAKAEVEFTNGTFRARTIGELDMESKSSTIDYENGHYLYMRSETDHYTIEKIDKIDGRKVYGSIKVDELGESFDLDGNNVDIKIRNINPNVSLIKINNKYGDVRLPVRNLKNYFVDFNGYYSTVFAPFQKEVVKEDEEVKEKELSKTDTKIESVYVRSLSRTSALAGELAPHHFTGTVGDVSGKHTRFELTCHSCTLDFK